MQKYIHLNIWREFRTGKLYKYILEPYTIVKRFYANVVFSIYLTKYNQGQVLYTIVPCYIDSFVDIVSSPLAVHIQDDAGLSFAVFIVLIVSVLVFKMCTRTRSVSLLLQQKTQKYEHMETLYVCF